MDEGEFQRRRNIPPEDGGMKWMRKTRLFWLALMMTAGIGWMMQAQAGVHAFRELEPKIAHDVRTILMKHGMPIRYDRGNEWFKISSGSTQWIGGNPSFGLYFYRANEIPLAAKMEIIEYCMKLYEETDRQYEIRILMLDKSFSPHIFEPSSYFELHLKSSQK